MKAPFLGGRSAMLAVIGAVAAALFYAYSYQCGNVAAIRNSVVVITGASSGIGEQLAYDYGKAGARVVIAARRESELQRVAAAVKAAGAVDVAYVPADMGNAADCERLISTAVERFGRIDTLVLNHAAFDEGLFQSYNSSEDIDSNFLRQFKTNVAGTAYTIRAAIPALIKSKGHIGIVSSGSVKVAAPFHPGYVTTKTALHGLAGVLRTEFALTQTPITVGVLVVGMVATPEVIKDEALKGLAISVQECAADMLCSLNARWEETYVPKWYWGWVLTVTAMGRTFSEFMMNHVYVFKVPRYVEAIAHYRDVVQRIAAGGK